MAVGTARVADSMTPVFGEICCCIHACTLYGCCIQYNRLWLKVGCGSCVECRLHCEASALFQQVLKCRAVCTSISEHRTLAGCLEPCLVMNLRSKTKDFQSLISYHTSFGSPFIWSPHGPRWCWIIQKMLTQEEEPSATFTAISSSCRLTQYTTRTFM